MNTLKGDTSGVLSRIDFAFRTKKFAQAMVVFPVLICLRYYLHRIV